MQNDEGYTAYIINEQLDPGIVRMPPRIQDDPDSPWYIDHYHMIGEYQINAWRGLDQQIETEVILPNNGNHRLAQLLLITAHQAIGETP